MDRAKRKTRTGIVLSDKMNKTVVVSVENFKFHPLYKKQLKRTTNLKAHDENNECKTGDTVKIVETRPLSKQKNWRVLDIVKKAK